MSTSTDCSTDARHRGLRATALVLTVLALLLGVYAAVGFLVVPAVARRELPRYLQRALHLRVAVGELRFNPFTLRADMRAFTLTTRAGAPLASFERLQIQGAVSSLWHATWTVRELQLDRPSLELVVERGGVLNWGTLLPSRAGAQRQPPQRQSQRTLALQIDSLRVRRGRIHFEDQTRASPFSTVVDPIELELLNFRSRPGPRSQLQLSARTASGERLDWSAQFSLQPLSSSGTVQLTGLGAQTLTRYLQNALPMALPSGNLEAHARYQWAAGPNGPATVRLDRVAIRNLAIAPKASAEAPWILLPQIEIRDASADLITHRLDVAHVSLHGPTVKAWHEPDGAVNLQRLFGSTATAGARGTGAGSGAIAGGGGESASAGMQGTGTASAAPSWVVRLQQLSIDGAALDLEDRAVSPAVRLRIRPLALQLRGYSSAPAAGPLSVDLSAGIGDAGKVHSQGQLDLDARRASFSVELQRLDLVSLQSYLARQTHISLYRGNLSASAQVRYAAAPDAGQSKLDLDGSLTLSDLATREHRSSSELVSWQTLALTGVRYRWQPDSLQIKQLRLRRAVGRVSISADGTLNLAQVLRPESDGARSASAVGVSNPPSSAAADTAHLSTSALAAPAPGEAASARMPISIDRIDVSGSAANFTDQSVRPTFSAAILGMHGSIVGLSSDPQSRARLQLAGQVERYAPVTIRGEINPLAATAYTDVAMSFSNIDLTLFNPYSGKFAGYSIEQGKLSTQMHYHVERRKLTASHHIVIDQLQFGPATANKPAVPLPVKLAVALLKDRHGVISLDLPVSGSIDDPNFHLAPIIGRVLLGLITKAVTAPFAWIGSAFGDGQQLSYVDFAAGSSTLPDADRQKIARLGKALSEHPQLKLDIPLHTVSVADDRVLAQQALAQAVAQASAPASESAQLPGPRSPERAAGTARSRRGARTAAGNAASPRLVALEILYRRQFHADPVYPAALDTGRPSVAASSAQPSAQDPRLDWLQRQLLPKFVPAGAQRTALGRDRADAVEAAILADKQLTPERLFLTDRLSGGGPAGMSRMTLQLQ